MYQLFCTLAPLCFMFCCDNSVARRCVSVLYGYLDIWIYNIYIYIYIYIVWEHLVCVTRLYVAE